MALAKKKGYTQLLQNGLAKEKGCIQQLLKHPTL